jgi:hypothetical protein
MVNLTLLGSLACVELFELEYIPCLDPCLLSVPPDEAFDTTEGGSSDSIGGVKQAMKTPATDRATSLTGFRREITVFEEDEEEYVDVDACVERSTVSELRFR